MYKNEYIETILNGILDFICVISSDKKIIYANKIFLNKMNYSLEEVTGKECYKIFRKSNRPCTPDIIDCPLEKVVRDKRKVQRVYKRKTKQGYIRYIEVSIYPIWEKDGKISKFIDISRDITEQKKEEEVITRRLENMVEERTRELKETQEKLLHKDKMASIGKLSASVVHEINNPIAGILNLIMLIKRIVKEKPTEQKDMTLFNKYIDMMDTETRRISRIVSNLLTFSRQSEIKIKPLDINSLIKKTLFLSSNLFKINNVVVENNLDDNLPNIVGSYDHLQQVFMNFISNAVEAMNITQGGMLYIITEHSPNKSQISVSFRDTGIGISKDNLPRLFEPFFTTKKKGKGVGLGLSVAYGIIQTHGGSIRVEHTKGEGAIFIVELPLKK